jgi:CubicO group peptidase (beta-lactamase class C family)
MARDETEAHSGRPALAGSQVAPPSWLLITLTPAPPGRTFSSLSPIQTPNYFPLFVNEPLLFTPGAQWSYRNAGYMVLGAVVEHLTGQTPFDYVQSNVFNVARMPNTGFWPVDQELPNRATPIQPIIRFPPPGTPGQPTIISYANTIYYQFYKCSPAGGDYSTVQDLMAFSNALMGLRLLTAQDTSTVLTPRVTIPGARERLLWFRLSYQDSKRT